MSDMPPSKRRIAVFSTLYFTGILTQFALFIATFFWGVTGTMEQNLTVVPILIVQGMAIMGSGMWWLPVCSFVAGLPKPRGIHG